MARAGTQQDAALWAPTDYVAGGAGSAAPWWGLFMAVPGSLTFFRVVVLNPFAAEAPGLEVRLWRVSRWALEHTGIWSLPGIERNL